MKKAIFHWHKAAAIFLTICLLIGLMPIYQAFAAGTIYYVSAENGNDGNNGLSLDAPFVTISKAANIMQAGDTCYIRGGVYREWVNINNKRETSEQKIRFLAYEGEWYRDTAQQRLYYYIENPNDPQNFLQYYAKFSFLNHTWFDSPMTNGKG